MKKIAWIIVFCPWFLFPPEAADLFSSGDWSETIDASDLIAGAGTDLISQYESATAATLITISNAPETGTWRVNARRLDSTWHNDFALYVRRTSDGSGPGTISGGAAYMELTTVDSEMFSGTKDRSDIAMQYKLSGMSVNVSPETYSSTVILTVVE